MMSRSLVKTAKTQFDLSFSMLENMIEKCPDDLWNEKKADSYSGSSYYMPLQE